MGSHQGDPSDAWSEANARVWGNPADGTKDASKDRTKDEDSDHAAAVAIASLPWQQAFLLAGSLRSSGIEAFLYPPDPPTTFAYGESLRRPHQVLVRRQDVDEARAIAAELSPA